MLANNAEMKLFIKIIGTTNIANIGVKSNDTNPILS